MTLFDLLSNIIQRVNVSLRTTPMALSDFEKQQARKNIGIVGTGKDGVDGYTPQKNIDYFDGKDGLPGKDGKDGYTPVKGVDYFDGAPGKDGQPGADGKDGYTPVKGKDYFDGTNGKDGVSVTHSWNGTVLTITSASGTSSADLRGPQGPAGEGGKDGVDGKTPVVGTDYFTEADKAEMVSSVIAQLPVYDGEVVEV